MNTMPTSATMTSENTVPIIFVRGVNKTYASGFQALKKINLEIKRGEIFALLGPNGAGKTTLISIICGIVNATSGTIIADGHDTVRDYRAARAIIGLVPRNCIRTRLSRSGPRSNSAGGCSVKRPTQHTWKKCCAICSCGTNATRKSWRYLAA